MKSFTFSLLLVTKSLLCTKLHKYILAVRFERGFCTAGACTKTSAQWSKHEMQLKKTTTAKKQSTPSHPASSNPIPLPSDNSPVILSSSLICQLPSSSCRRPYRCRFRPQQIAWKSFRKWWKLMCHPKIFVPHKVLTSHSSLSNSKTNQVVVTDYISLLPDPSLPVCLYLWSVEVGGLTLPLPSLFHASICG